MLNRTHFLVLAALAVLSGCKKSENPGSTAAGQTPGAQAQVLHFGNGTEPQDLDPQIVTGVPENKIVNALFEGLVAYGPNGRARSPPPPSAGRSRRTDWSIPSSSSRGTLVKRRSRDRAALCSSYQRLLTPSLAAEYANKLFPVVGAEEYYRGQLKDFSQTGFKAIDPTRSRSP
jgi:oligopeptide transport system substrate-binding protein